MATLSAKDVAARFDTTPRELRKFLRADAKKNGGTVGVDTPGKGGRYQFETRQLKSLQKRFNKWVLARTPVEEVTDTETEVIAEEPTNEVELIVEDEVTE